MHSHFIEVIVVDNDPCGSAETIIDELRPPFFRKGIAIIYEIESHQGIASARNHAVSLANGKYVAFIDDDETASHLWLTSLYNTLIMFGVDGVWGPVVPQFPPDFPKWQRPFFKRPRFVSGTDMSSKSKGTGNALIKSECLKLRNGPFNTFLDLIGGSDTDLFLWLSKKSLRFVWCDEAVVYELQPISRSTTRWHIKRAYRGGWGFSYNKSMHLGRAKSFVLVVLWIPPTLIVNMIKALGHRCHKSILLEWLRIISTQLGKLGYFLGFISREYLPKKAL
jgi:glycosyltransferase involved in cell wall biosynthesis